MNPFTYVENRPMKEIDPLGLHRDIYRRVDGACFGKYGGVLPHAMKMKQ